jgi:hypothetical protein
MELFGIHVKTISKIWGNRKKIYGMCEVHKGVVHYPYQGLPIVTLFLKSGNTGLGNI